MYHLNATIRIYDIENYGCHGGSFKQERRLDINKNDFNKHSNKLVVRPK